MRHAVAPTIRGPWHDAGALLSWAALVLGAVAQIAGGIWPIVAGLLFFLAGLSHGAGDENDGAIHGHSPVHVLAYLIAAGAVAALFLAFPLAGLALFLGLSAWHFARSDIAMAFETRLAIAALATGGSALFRHRETAGVFGEITGGAVPGLLVDVLALAGIAGAGLALWIFVIGKRGAGHALIALGTVVLCHPVLAVGLIFLIAHAVPIQQRQMRRYGSQAVWRAVAWPSLVALVGAALIVLAVEREWIAMQLAVALAFGMATPHMLTERLER